ncbi:peptide/nickel transport system substrate-binding protein [Modestobacter sp. DSM 44400]|uniref:ABC transporter substrate-binding protein n=1 Tax=Modestobacter sp. DSM 44400 TaxID=1550230 RepID=UPI00089ABC44|nr:ABC transporter substrate-binding protein [Modestobacter sp. DSM 44400]SDY08391.1 peptide/nickel transport system substrate-binding protein [Modestobacter sp. DSM 44400]
MIDEPGPWGTGPFTLVQGASSITTRNVVMSADPYRASWFIESEQRDPQVVLEANPDHWNRAARGPRIERAVFRNDVTPDEALRLVCDTEGEVDIVTEVSPADAQRVQDSAHARLVVCDANRVLVGILNRNSDAPLDDLGVRRALNMAIDRQAIIEQGLAGYASVIPALTPNWCSGFPAGAVPYELDAARAREAFSRGSWPARRPLRIATPEPFAGIAHMVAASIRSTLDLMVEVIVVPPDQAPGGARALVEKKLDLPWDVLIHAWFDLSSEAPPAAVHREFFGLDGAFRAGPPDDAFDALFDEMKVQLDGGALVAVAERIDAYVHDQALALFICAPQALYAVNEHVTFSPYKTTFELAEVTVDDRHWSVTGGGAELGARTARSQSKPGFAGAAGNAC